MARDDWPEMSYTGAMMADLRRKGIAPAQDDAAAQRQMEQWRKEREAKEQAAAQRRANLPPERIIVDVLRGKKPRAGRATERKAHEIVAALYKAGWSIERLREMPGDADG